MTINKRNIAKMAKDIEAEFAKHPVRIPLEATMPGVSLPRQQMNALLRVFYERRAFSDVKTCQLSEAAEEAGFGTDRDLAQEIYWMAKDEGLVDQLTFGGGGFLTAAGRTYVENLVTSTPTLGSTSITNNFNGTITNSQIVTGPDSVQQQTNAIDVEQLSQLIELIHEFDHSQLDAVDQAEFLEDVTVLEAQRTSPAVPVPGYRRALRNIHAIAIGTAGSTTGQLIAGVITHLV